MRRTDKSIGAATVLLAIVLVPLVASAFAFTPIEPARCPSFTESPFSYSVRGGSGVWEQPRDLNTNRVYIDNIDHSRTIIGHQFTSRFGLQFDQINTEACCDSVQLIVPSGATATLAGSPGAGLGMRPKKASLGTTSLTEC